MLADALVAKYDVAGPRYTSYPTVPYWETTPSEAQWLERVARRSTRRGRARARRSTCTFRSAARCAPSAAAIPASRAATASCRRTSRRCWPSSICTCARSGRSRLELGELHFGGGTPTFLDRGARGAAGGSVEARARLRAGAVGLDRGRSARDHARSSWSVLARYGFRRISLGVQDFDPRVQDIVNRVQSEQQVREVTERRAQLGFDSVNFDLIYGLPLQTRASVERTDGCGVPAAARSHRALRLCARALDQARPAALHRDRLPQGEHKRALYELRPRAARARGLSRDRPGSLRARERTLWQAQRAAPCIAISWATPPRSRGR